MEWLRGLRLPTQCILHVTDEKRVTLAMTRSDMTVFRRTRNVIHVRYETSWPYFLEHNELHYRLWRFLGWGDIWTKLKPPYLVATTSSRLITEQTVGFRLEG